MMEAIRSSGRSALTRATRRNIPEDDVLHRHSREKCNVSPVKYELCFYIPQDDILHSHCRENLKSYIALTGWTL
jgi:hypothetical protein